MKREQTFTEHKSILGKYWHLSSDLPSISQERTFFSLLTAVVLRSDHTIIVQVVMISHRPRFSRVPAPWDNPDSSYISGAPAGTFSTTNTSTFSTSPTSQPRVVPSVEMTPATSTQPQHSSGRRNCDMFSRYPRPSISANNAGVTVAVPASSEIVVEIATPGARPPLHFAKESSAFHRYSRSNECERGPATRHHEAPSARWQSMPVAALGSSARGLSCTPQKHHRRTSTPLDGVCFTLLGVSTGLKTPGVNHWSVATALVESSVDLRTRNAKGMTPLHLACAAGQVRKKIPGQAL